MNNRPIDRSSEPLLKVRDLEMHFPGSRGLFGRSGGDVKAVDGVSFDLWSGETLGLVGESGCGKSTTGRALLRLIEPTSGSVHFDGQDVRGMDRSGLRAMRRRAQFVFQDPFGSLNPRCDAGRGTLRAWVGAAEPEGASSGDLGAGWASF